MLGVGWVMDLSGMRPYYVTFLFQIALTINRVKTKTDTYSALCQVLCSCQQPCEIDKMGKLRHRNVN